MSEEQSVCTFCEIAAGRIPAEVVWEDDDTIAFLDPRQVNPGHTLVIPRRHVRDLRELGDYTSAALMSALLRITRAVDSAFANEGLSIWHSIGPAAFQEVPHLHLHVLPRRTGDGLLRVYPRPPETAPPDALASMAERIRERL